MKSCNSRSDCLGFAVQHSIQHDSDYAACRDTAIQNDLQCCWKLVVEVRHCKGDQSNAAFIATAIRLWLPSNFIFESVSGQWRPPRFPVGRETLNLPRHRVNRGMRSSAFSVRATRSSQSSLIARGLRPEPHRRLAF
jgi:hypothetical protein